VAPGDVQPVSLMFRSPRSLTGVTITLQLPEGVELAGHPARRELAWQADLQAGANRLDLPVVVRHGGGGVLTAQLAHGRDRRQIAVLIEPRRDPAPPAGGASVADGFTSA
jgi:hypothetical protein